MDLSAALALATFIGTTVGVVKGVRSILAEGVRLRVQLSGRIKDRDKRDYVFAITIANQSHFPVVVKELRVAVSQLRLSRSGRRHLRGSRYSPVPRTRLYRSLLGGGQDVELNIKDPEYMMFNCSMDMPLVAGRRHDDGGHCDVVAHVVEQFHRPREPGRVERHDGYEHLLERLRDAVRRDARLVGPTVVRPVQNLQDVELQLCGAGE
jgi:hypothetical protein